jgi:xylose isomerase
LSRFHAFLDDFTSTKAAAVACNNIRLQNDTLHVCAQEQENAARFLRFAARHAKKIGFRGPLMLEPKPQVRDVFTLLMFHGQGVEWYQFNCNRCFLSFFFLSFFRQEPSKHQYDFDAATTHAFLLRHGLLKEGNFGLNIECNHATLSGHSCFHELTYASEAGLLASIDINSGDAQVGWVRMNRSNVCKCLAKFHHLLLLVEANAFIELSHIVFCDF